MSDQSRKLNLIDAIVFIAAFAIGLYWVKFQQNSPRLPATGALIDRGTYEIRSQFRTKNINLIACAYWMGAIAPIVAMSAAGNIVIGLIRSRGARSATFSQPGLAASVAVTATVVLEWTRLALYASSVWWSKGFQYPLGGVLNNRGVQYGLYQVLRPPEIGTSVAVVWMVLILARLFRTSGALVEWLGMLIGAFWIILTLIYWIAPF